jgi:hypothetical protein
MNKAIFLVWLTFNPNHTANLAYMGGHEYATEAACSAASDKLNTAASAAMEVTTEKELPEMEFACTTFAPTHAGMVLTVDIESIADDTEFFIKAD